MRLENRLSSPVHAHFSTARLRRGWSRWMEGSFRCLSACVPPCVPQFALVCANEKHGCLAIKGKPADLAGVSG